VLQWVPPTSIWSTRYALALVPKWSIQIWEFSETHTWIWRASKLASADLSLLIVSNAAWGRQSPAKLIFEARGTLKSTWISWALSRPPSICRCLRSYISSHTSAACISVKGAKPSRSKAQAAAIANPLTRVVTTTFTSLSSMRSLWKGRMQALTNG